MKTWKPLTSHPHLKQLWATYRGSRVWIFGVCWHFLWQTIKYNMLQIIVNRLFKDQLGAKRDMNNFNLCNIYFSNFSSPPLHRFDYSSKRVKVNVCPVTLIEWKHVKNCYFFFIQYYFEYMLVGSSTNKLRVLMMVPLFLVWRYNLLSRLSPFG